MIAEQSPLPRLAELEQAIGQRIAERTGRRIQGLAVEAIATCVVVRGCAASFHLKQLAIQGVFDVIGAHDIEINVLINVSSPRVIGNLDEGKE